MTSQVELRLQGAMDHLRIVWQTGETLLESVPFAEDPDGSRYNVLLAVQEMLTNVLRHGYLGDESAPVTVTFETDESGISVVMRDCGPAFDPLEVPHVEDVGGPPQEGGYGIMIAKVVMDEVSYERDGSWNVLRMTKAARAVVPLENMEQG